MNRKIVDFYLDDDNHWVALLECAHGQHVRHQPPFVNRDWTQTRTGREAMLETELNCLKCERLELPQGVRAYKETPVFTQDSVPAGLLRDHATKAGVWGRIHVLAGTLSYSVTAPFKYTWTLSPDVIGVIAPEVLHHVTSIGDVRFKVEFMRVA